MANIYIDVTKPIIINSSVIQYVKNDNTLRRVCFVSKNQSTLEANKYQYVTNSDYVTYIKKGKEDGELANQLKAFFAFTTSGKGCYIYELGEPTIADLPDITLTINEAGDALEFRRADAIVSSVELLPKQRVKIIIDKKGQTFNVTLPTYSKGAQNGIHTENSADEAIFICDSAPFTINAPFSTDTGLNIELPLKAIQPSDSTLTQEQISNLKHSINERENPCYIYALDSDFYNSPFISDLLTFNDTSAQQYFFFDTKSLDTGSQAFQNVKGSKCAHLVYDNATNYKLMGAILGKFASNYFDISASMPASALNYKQLQGLNFTSLTSTQASVAIDNCFTFAGDLGGYSVILGARWQDGMEFSFWYQWDNIQNAITSKIQSILLNSVNNPINTIRFNQNGIDMLKTSIESALDAQVDLGTLNAYATSYDLATNIISGLNNISALSFAEFSATYPEKYADELYDGFSFYAQIGKYIRQVVIGATLG